MDDKKKVELTEDELEQVTGGVLDGLGFGAMGLPEGGPDFSNFNNDNG